MDEKFGLNKKTVNELYLVFAKYPQINKVIIYGSRAKGNYRPGSDIDLTIEGDNFNVSDLLHIMNDLDDTNIPYKVDISIFSQLDHPHLIDHINRIGQIFYQK